MADPQRCPSKNFAIQSPGKLRNIYFAAIPAEHTIDDVLSPDYFGRLLSQPGACRVNDLIQVEWEDGTKYGELAVRALDAPTEKCITALRGDIYEYGVSDLPKGWTMEFRNKQVGYAILFSGEQREAGFLTKDAAAMRINFLAVQNAQGATARSAIKTRPAQTEAEPAKKPKAPADA